MMITLRFWNTVKIVGNIYIAILVHRGKFVLPKNHSVQYICLSSIDDRCDRFEII